VIARSLAGLAALALLAGGCGGNQVGPAPPGPLRVPAGDAPQRGPSDAWVTVVEFSDFECPACLGAEPVVLALLADLPADVRLLYRHFPLPQHANAGPAAEAAECARLQGTPPDGSFWAMHDALFETQASWAPLSTDAATAAFATLAGQIAVPDAVAWRTCMTTHATQARVAADQALAAPFLRGTPTFVVNGTAVLGVPGLRVAVEGALAWARQSGIPRSDYYDKAVLGL
jgi:protein-disulfide isomerase